MTFSYPAGKPGDAFSESMLKRGCIYAIDLSFQMSLPEWFDNFWMGKIRGPTLEPDGPVRGPVEFVGPQVVQAMYNFGDVTFERMENMFENVSTSLTNYIRENGVSDYSASAIGVAKQEKTCIGVHWPWLALPSALVIVTLVFLVLLVLEPQPNGTGPGIWRASPLPLLYCGLSNTNGPATPAFGKFTDNYKCMEDVAKCANARLRSGSSGAICLEIQASDKTM